MMFLSFVFIKFQKILKKKAEWKSNFLELRQLSTGLMNTEAAPIIQK